MCVISLPASGAKPTPVTFKQPYSESSFVTTAARHRVRSTCRAASVSRAANGLHESDNRLWCHCWGIADGQECENPRAWRDGSPKRRCGEHSDTERSARCRESDSIHEKQKARDDGHQFGGQVCEDQWLHVPSLQSQCHHPLGGLQHVACWHSSHGPTRSKSKRPRMGKTVQLARSANNHAPTVPTHDAARTPDNGTSQFLIVPSNTEIFSKFSRDKICSGSDPTQLVTQEQSACEITAL